MVTLIIVSLIILAVVTWSAIAAVHYNIKYNELKKKLANKYPLELELATSEQLIEELQKRPQIQYILLMPSFEPLGVCLNIEVHNIPPEVSVDLIRMAYQLTTRQQITGEEITGEENA